MKDINTVRKAVATMANQLHKFRYSLSQAFKTAWKRVKNSMKYRIAGVREELKAMVDVEAQHGSPKLPLPVLQ